MIAEEIYDFECGFGLQWGMDLMNLPCGGIAYYEEESTCHSYRCDHCGAVVGSIGMPKHCKDITEQWEIQKALGGEGWDYFAECER